MTAYKPKVGERALLVSSPDPADASLVGRDGLVSAVRDTDNPRHYWQFTKVSGSGECTFGIHRYAVWAPVEPPASEPSDPIAVLRVTLGWVHDQGGLDTGGPEQRLAADAHAALDALESERAAHAAEVERLKIQLDERAGTIEALRSTCDDWEKNLRHIQGSLNRERAEVERLKRQHEEEWQLCRKPLYDRAVAAEAEVERLRSEIVRVHKLLVTTRDLIGTAKRIRLAYFGATIQRYGAWESQSNEERAAWINAAKGALFPSELPIPSDDELAQNLFDSWCKGKRLSYVDTQLSRRDENVIDAWRHVARIAKANLLGGSVEPIFR